MILLILAAIDSKKLTEEERDGLFDKVKDNSDFVGYTVKVLMPQDISRWMLGRVNYNLNAMSHDTAIALVADALNRGVNVQEVYVDTVGDPKKYQEKLQQRFPAIGKIVVAKKADSLYPVVSAASICAKVTRDDVLRRWAFAEKMAAEPSRAFGSGYPSDPATVAWLAENIDRVFGFPRLIRFSWSTCTTLLQKKGVDVEWFEQQQQDQAEADPQVQSITSFFKKDGATDAEEGAVSASSEPKSFTCLQRLKRLQRF